MGGIGSGGHNRKGNGAVEEHRCLSINFFRDAGWLFSGSIRWNSGANISAYLQLNGLLTLEYNHRVGGYGEWEKIKQFIQIDKQPRHLGGFQGYFICPGQGCGKRVTKLYGAGRYFLCCRCYGLNYASQQTRDIDRINAEIGKVRMALETPSDWPWMSTPPRPRYMRKKRYAELTEKLFQLSMQFDWLLESKLAVGGENGCRRSEDSKQAAVGQNCSPDDYYVIARTTRAYPIDEISP
uniref:Uncharacterized protein n=1 Tax=Magnetococcus massalia (strain MO-1) TaxID=451514 RepID=A0A1S7LK64_MAGMO|nr:Conserved protein of unknown function [Candidatus Magnetococcus massalia]